MNYTEIIDAVKQYADRQDIEVDNNLDVFIVMAEARMNRVLKTREQSKRAFVNTVTEQEYYPLPPDYAGMRDIQFNAAEVGTKSFSFTYLNQEQFNIRRNQPFGGKNYYCIIANQFQIFPKQDAGSTIEIVYYQKVPNLNHVDHSNWMSDSHPDIYLAGLMSEVELFVKNYDTAKLWYSRMSIAIAELDKSDIDERWAGTPLTVKLG